MSKFIKVLYWEKNDFQNSSVRYINVNSVKVYYSPYELIDPINPINNRFEILDL